MTGHQTESIRKANSVYHEEKALQQITNCFNNSCKNTKRHCEKEKQRASERKREMIASEGEGKSCSPLWPKMMIFCLHWLFCPATHTSVLLSQHAVVCTNCTYFAQFNVCIISNGKLFNWRKEFMILTVYVFWCCFSFQNEIERKHKVKNRERVQQQRKNGYV